jgi:hypothetical protein
VTTVAFTGFSRDRPGAARGTSAGGDVASPAGEGAAVADAVPDAPISSCSFLSMREVSLPPGTHRFSRSSFFWKIDSEYSSQLEPHWPQSCWAIAAIIRRGSGRPSASFMRSAISIAGSCQGDPSSASPAPPRAAAGASSPGIRAAASSAESGVAGASSCSRPAKKPLSQVRCSGLNGADSGRISRIGGRGVDWFIPRPRARTWR